MRRFTLFGFVHAFRQFCSAGLASLAFPARRRRNQSGRMASRRADISIERLEPRTLLSAASVADLPFVQSVELASPAGHEASGPTVSYTFTFNEAVTGVDASDFQIVKNGPVSDSTVSVTQVSESIYTVTVTGINGAGELGVNLVDDGTIRDLTGHMLTRPNESLSFQSLPMIITDSTPISVTEGDLNGDGIADLVFAKFENDTINVLLGNGDGTFQPQQSFAVGDEPGPVTLADVNGDGKLDVLTANFANNSPSSSLSVLLGNGDGTFQGVQTVGTGPRPYAIVVADLNGDGNVDVAVGNYGSNTVSVLLGHGDGTFDSQQTLTTDDGPVSLAAADFNGDGKTDLVVSNSRGQSVSVLRGNGDGTFQSPETYLAGTRPYAVVASDLNGDGKPDLAVTSLAANTVSVLLGNGDGSFQPQQAFATGTSPSSLWVGDLNGDGKPDLITTNENSKSVSLLRGNGDGTFQPQTTLDVGERPMSVAVGDLNGDGRTDLVVTNINDNTLSMFVNTMSGSVAGPVYSISNGNNAPTIVMSSSQITYGTSTAQISGQLMAPVGTPDGEFIQISVAGQTQSVSLDSSGQFSASFDTSSLKVGSYSIQVTYAGDNTQQPASIMNSSLSLVVAAATPTVTAADAGGIFNNHPFAATASATGVHGETVNGFYTFTYYTGTTASGPSSTTPPFRARTYTVVATFTSNDPNYANAISAPVTFVIAKAPPTFSWRGLDGTYNGSEFPTTVYVLGVDGYPINGTPTFTYYSGTSVSGSGFTTAPTDAGVYTVVAHYPGGNSNYLVMSSDPVILTIAPATPEIAVTTTYKEYDGTPFTPTASVTGLDGTEVNGSTTFTYYAGYEAIGIGSTTPPTNPGIYTLLASFVSGDSNYANIQSEPVVIWIDGIIPLTTPTITVSAAGGTYNSYPFPATASVVGTEGETVNGTTTLTYYVGTSVNGTGSTSAPVGAGTYTVVATFVSGTGTYGDATSDPVTFTITQATPYVSVFSLGSVYTGSPLPASAFALGVPHEGQYPDVNGYMSYRYYVGTSVDGAGTLTPPTNVGRYTIVVDFTSLDANYANSSSNPTAFVITLANPVLVATNPGGTFNGNPFATTLKATGINGVPIPGTPMFIYHTGLDLTSESLFTAPTNVGTYTVQSLFSSSDPNYGAAWASPVTFSITQATPTVVVSNAGGIYNGNSLAASATVTGAGGVAVSGTTTLTYYNGSTVSGAGSTSAPTSVGTYTAVASFVSGDANYTNASSDPVTFTISKATPTVVVSNAGGTYNGNPFPASATTTGASGEVVSGTTTLMYYTGSTVNGVGTTVAPTNAGTYTVLASFVSGSGNYNNASSSPVTFTIAKATPTIVASSSGGNYNGLGFGPSTTVTGVAGVYVYGNTTTTYYTGNTVSGAGTSAAPSNVGTYTAVVSFVSGDTNYNNASSSPVTFTIAAATPNLLFSSPSDTYTGFLVPVTLDVQGAFRLPVSGTKTLTYYVGSSTTGVGSSTPPKDAGTYTVIGTFVSNDPNYVSTSSTVTYAIKKATPQVNVSSPGGTYNGNAFVANAIVPSLDGVTHLVVVNGITSFTYYVGNSVNGTGSATAPINAGTYTVVASFVSANPNYNNSVSAPVTFTIAPASPTVVVSTAGGAYNGNSIPASATVVGVGGVAVNGTTTITYYIGGIVSGTGTSVAPSNMGTYTAVATFVSGDANYNNASSSPVTFTIAAAMPNLVLASSSDTYTGFPVPVTFDVRSATNLPLSGTKTVTYYTGSSTGGVGTSTPPKDAGTYTVVGTFVSDDSNYANATSTLTYTINKATPRVIVSNPSGTYTGNTFVPAAIVPSLDGITHLVEVNGTTTFTYYVGNSVNGTGSTTAPINAGTYTVVASFVSANPNYNNAVSNPVTFTIAPATPTVVASDSGGAYSGSPFPATATVTGLGGVAVSGTTTFTYYTGSTVTGTGTSTAPTNVGTYTVVASFVSGDVNYGNASGNPVTFTISKTTPTVVVTSSGGTYSGNPLPASVTAMGAGGVAVSGTTTFTYYTGSTVTGTGTSTAPTNAGTYTVVASFVSGDANYGNASSSPVTFTISIATPTVVATNSGGTYNGNSFPASATATGAGGVAVSGATTFTYYTGGTVNGTGTSTAPTNAGTYTAVASFVSGDVNYGNASSSPVTFTVSKATPTVVTSDSGGTYNGNSFPASTTATGLGGVAVSGTTTFTYYTGSTVTGTGTSTAPTNAGIYSVVASFVSGDANYENASSSPVTFTISKSTPTVVASNSGGTYNGNSFPASTTATGLGGVAVSGTTTFTYYSGSTVTGTGSSTAPTNAGTYTVVASFASGDVNYGNASSSPVTFTISKSTPTVVASDRGGTYNGNPFPASASATGVGGVAVSGTTTFTYYSGSTVTGTGSSTAPTNAGTYTVVASFVSGDVNYGNASSSPVTFTISIATPIVVASNSGGTYNGNPFPASATVTGLGGGAVSGTTTFTYYTGSIVTGTGTSTAPTNAGTYTVVASFTSGDVNYGNASSSPVTFTIATATPLVTAIAASGPFTGNRFNASATATGVGGLTVSGTTIFTYYSGGTVSGTGSATAPSAVGTYTVVASFTSSDSNYRNATSSPVTFTIYAAPTKLLISPSLPTTIVAGSSTGPIKVQVLDANGNVVTADNLTPLSLTVNGSVVATATAINGTFTFQSLQLTTAGTVTIAVTSPSLTQATARITVNPGAASELLFTAQPQQSDGTNTIVAGSTLTVIKVAVRDAYGNIVTTDNSSISLSVNNLIGGPSEVSTLKASTVNGVATFSGIVFKTAGTYSLTATSSKNSLTMTSNTFKVNPAAAAKLVFATTFPAKLSLGSTTAPIVVLVEDQYGNVVTDNSSATLTLMLNGTVVTSAQASNGTYTFAGLVLKSKGNNSITVTSPGLSQASTGITVN